MSVYAQDERAAFQFQTKAKYLRPYRQFRDHMDVKERVCSGRVVMILFPTNHKYLRPCRQFRKYIDVNERMYGMSKLQEHNFVYAQDCRSARVQRGLTNVHRQL